ncbi:MAG: TetR/AcrR family transcriptional regulator [Brachybacterium tyrofermentans]|uniref:TetR/AcrR family transcriptional regulator n=1 Tax=Brachybacterium tyrofermentans TaxID=47848 RepID=A0ABW0FDP6_9MICO|nr:TetR/AcrR family transcriptional regulator [Brachybacterium tyrofermentans]SLM97118.1 Transcriptional regulator, TetR family [Corynebacterium xerosis]
MNASSYPSVPPDPLVEESDDAGDDRLGLRETKKRQTRLAMHRAAVELVAEHGFTPVTVEMIARRAGVSTRTFFNHWVTKDAAVLGVVPGESREIAASLRAELEVHGPRDALRHVLRDVLAGIPADPELRDLKKQVMSKEPRLHTISSGNLIEVQSELVEVLTEAMDGEDARMRAVIVVQVGFALTRSAFGFSMSTGMDLPSAYDRVIELYDAGLQDD